MTPGGSPWADPATQTQPGAPYAGAPPTGPAPGPQYGQYPAAGYPPAGYGHPMPYGTPPYGTPPYWYGSDGYGGPWGPVPPRAPQRPGQVITAAVLAFVQAGVLLIASLYLWFFASVIDIAAQESPEVYDLATANALATEGTVLAVVQLLSAVLLVVAGIRGLNARTRGAWLLVLAAHAVQVLLALYWAVRLTGLMHDAPGPDAEGALLSVTLFFATAPLVALGLLLIGAGRRWFDGTARA